MGLTRHEIKVVTKSVKENAIVIKCSCGHWEGWGPYSAGPILMDNARRHQRVNGGGDPDAE